MHCSSLLFLAVVTLMGLVSVQAAPIQLIQGEFVQGKGWIATETIKVLQTRATQVSFFALLFILFLMVWNVFTTKSAIAVARVVNFGFGWKNEGKERRQETSEMLKLILPLLPPFALPFRTSTVFPSLSPSKLDWSPSSRMLRPSSTLSLLRSSGMLRRRNAWKCCRRERCTLEEARGERARRLSSFSMER
ncbi:hypothetical protein BDY24DRAFT_266195 [Mrakia frigida]|uniref:uncharacterized protein n=1 Tax=Mrakia frigida TaxID=29902 RepID=UPI003FCBF030